MLFYQVKIHVKPSKNDEFVSRMLSFSCRIRRQKGCLSCNVYQDYETEDLFSIIGEWKTQKAMEKHFKSREFEVLIGAAKSLGETFTINTAEVYRTGGFELAREQMAKQQ